MENEIPREAEHLVTLLQDIRGPAQTVYDETEKFVDTVPDGLRNPIVDTMLNLAHDALAKGDKLTDMSRFLLTIPPYPRYKSNERYWRGLETRSDEQRERLDRHHRPRCLGDGPELQRRKDAAQAVFDGIGDVYSSLDILFYHLDTRRLTSDTRRMLDGVIELSLDYIETIAGVVLDLTKIAPPEPALSR